MASATARTLLLRRLLLPAPTLTSRTSCIRASWTFPKSQIVPLPKHCSRLLSSGSADDDLKREKVLTVPNLLCVSRIVASPYLVQLVVSGQHKMALGLFAYAGITDLVRQ